MAKVTFENCRNELLTYASPRGRAAFEQWENRPGYEAVVDFVKDFSHAHLYSVTSPEIAEVIRESDHALGHVQAHEALDLVEDFTAPFAFQHLFHWYLERHRKVPTWLEFRNWMVEGEASPHWYLRLKAFLETNGQAYTRQQWSRAAKWRLGKVYMSNMRELDLMVRTREAGLPLRYHLLADVLLRVDFWYRNVLVCLFFSNSRYRSKTSGRKVRAADFFPPAGGHFTILDVEIARQGYGNIWLAKPSEIKRLVDTVTSNVR
jgi:hypothetical protein